MQQTQSDVAHQELLDALKAQDEILQDLTDTAPPTETPAPAKQDDALTDAQREAVEAQFGDGSIAAAWEVGPGRGNRPRLVRLGVEAIATDEANVLDRPETKAYAIDERVSAA